jgi:hypothetical protein
LAPLNRRQADRDCAVSLAYVAGNVVLRVFAATAILATIMGGYAIPAAVRTVLEGDARSTAAALVFLMFLSHFSSSPVLDVVRG